MEAHHIYGCGKTGSGKSTFLKNEIFARQRIDEVEGVVAMGIDEDDRSIAFKNFSKNLVFEKC